MVWRIGGQKSQQGSHPAPNVWRCLAAAATKAKSALDQAHSAQQSLGQYYEVEPPLLDSLQRVGYYCGRSGEGFWGEPQNSLSNLAFILVAALAFTVWRKSETRDPWQLLLICLAGLIGVGSYVFHSLPGPSTLRLDLIPIQIFGLAALLYLLRAKFLLPLWSALLAVAGFFLLRQGWIIVAPRGTLGGAITHVPTVVLLALCGSWLSKRGDPLGRYLFAATGLYGLAILARSLDVAFCQSFPFGFHWLWHCLTAAVTGAILLGLIARAP